MPQLPLRFLSTAPPTNKQGFSVPNATRTNPTTEACSSRSQVRGLSGESHHQSFEQSAGARVSRNPPTLDEGASAPKYGDGKRLVIRSTNCRIKKRSLKRALQQADRDGKAVYKGGIIPKWTPPYEPRTSTPSVMPWIQRSDRIKIVQWNCGGLSQELQLEWYTWLRKDPEIGVFILAGTHWTFTNDFQSEGWTLIHTGMTSKKGAGILIGIRSDLTDRSSLKWNELEAGRLLHVRCQIQRQQFDVLAIYQHAMLRANNADMTELMAKRCKLWQKMDKALAGFPFRSSLLVAGDFNMVFSPLAEVAGGGIHAGGDTECLKLERAEVMGILQARRLVVLNSWGKPAITYHHPNGESQIDYILTRKQDADLEARKCAPVKPRSQDGVLQGIYRWLRRSRSIGCRGKDACTERAVARAVRGSLRVYCGHQNQTSGSCTAPSSITGKIRRASLPCPSIVVFNQRLRHCGEPTTSSSTQQIGKQ